jgi:hypothetical protein
VVISTTDRAVSQVNNIIGKITKLTFQESEENHQVKGIHNMVDLQIKQQLIAVMRKIRFTWERIQYMDVNLTNEMN